MCPRRASIPTSPDPGVTGRPSAPSTLTTSLMVNLGPAAGPSESITVPAAPVSVAPNESAMNAFGKCFRSSSLTGFDMIAPPDPMTARFERS